MKTKTRVFATGGQKTTPSVINSPMMSPPEDRAEDGPHAADDDDHERLGEDAVPHFGSDILNRRRQDPRKAREGRPDAEDEGEDLRDVDPQGGDHLAVIRSGPDDRAQLRLGKKKPDRRPRRRRSRG